MRLALVLAFVLVATASSAHPGGQGPIPSPPSPGTGGGGINGASTFVGLGSGQCPATLGLLCRVIDSTTCASQTALGPGEHEAVCARLLDDQGAPGWFLVGGAMAGGSAHGNGSNCASGEVPLGVDADGAVEGCYEPQTTDLTDFAVGVASAMVPHTGDANAHHTPPDLAAHAALGSPHHSADHASRHSASGADEVLAEDLGDGCTPGQIVTSDGDGTRSCSAAPGGIGDHGGLGGLGDPADHLWASTWTKLYENRGDGTATLGFCLSTNWDSFSPTGCPGINSVMAAPFDMVVTGFSLMITQNAPATTNGCQVELLVGGVEQAHLDWGSESLDAVGDLRFRTAAIPANQGADLDLRFGDPTHAGDAVCGLSGDEECCPAGAACACAGSFGGFWQIWGRATGSER